MPGDWSHGYDDVGNFLSQKDGEGMVTSFVFDELHRVDNIGLADIRIIVCVAALVASNWSIAAFGQHQGERGQVTTLT